jgi:hypothetical protein
MILMKNLEVKKVCMKMTPKILSNDEQQRRRVVYTVLRMMNSSTESSNRDANLVFQYGQNNAAEYKIEISKPTPPKVWMSK